MAATPDQEPVGQDERLHELIGEYHRELDRAGTVDRNAFLAAHAEFRSELESYFQSVDSVERLAGPTRATTHAGSPIEQTVLTPPTGQTAPAATQSADTPAGDSSTAKPKSADSGTHSQETGDTIVATQIEGSRTEFRPQAGQSGMLLDRFGRYRIVKELGRGAMGAVYLAHDEQLDREVALKIPQFGQDLNAGMLERFYREARAAAALRHPGICPVFDVGEIDGQHYITMAYIKGRALRDFTKSSKRQKGKQVARVVRKIALAMAEAHRHNVVHRDLKPANVMIDERNEPVVMDFGLARRSVEGEERLTHTGTIIGTPAYMSPEQVDGDNDNVGAHSDIYSLGVIFYELLTGQLPFQGNLMSILKQISTTEPRPPIELHDDIDPTLQSLCLQMLEKQAVDRPASMAEVAKSLSDWLSGRQSPIDESGVLETSRAPGQSRQHTAKTVEATEPMTAPGQPDPEPVANEFPLLSNLAVTMQHPRQDARRHTSRGGPPKNQKWLLFGGLGGAAILLAGIVFFVQLGKVTVQITLNDPQYALKVDGDDVILQGGKDEIRLSGGEHTLTVMLGDLIIDAPKNFTVDKNGTNAVSVVVLDEKVQIVRLGEEPPSAIASNADRQAAATNEAGTLAILTFEDIDPSEFAAHRKLAEWVIGNQGGVINTMTRGSLAGEQQFAEIGSEVVNLRSIADLPQEPFAVWRVGFHGRRNFDDDALKELLALTQRVSTVININLGNVSITPKGLTSLVASGDRLINLGLPDNIQLDDTIVPWLSKLTHLKLLNIVGTGISPEGAERLRRALPDCTIQYRVNSREKPQTSDVTGNGWPGKAPLPAVAPFDEAQAKAHQAAWARHLGEPVVTTNSIGMKLAVIPPGEFTMGEGDGAVPVTLTRPCRVGVYEVTQREWLRVMQTEPWKDQQVPSNGDNVPASSIKWDEATNFCRRLTDLERVAGTISEDWEYRLPTEAEWEHAARAGTLSTYSFADTGDQLIDYAWFDENASKADEPYPHPVGQKKPNPWGLYDIYGNVGEWCSDWYGSGLPGGTNPTGPAEGARKNLRGGGFESQAKYFGSGKRYGANPDYLRPNYGFRVILSPTGNVVGERIGPLIQASVSTSPPPAVAPFDEAQAKAHQDAWAKHLGEPVVTTNSIGMKLAVIPPGTFKMGANKNVVDVTLTQPFRLGIHEVTQRQWKAVMDGSEPWKEQSGVIEGDDVAATFVSWTDATEFCHLLTERERAAGTLREGWEYRLPTEAEWEWACRAGTTTWYSFGDDESLVGEYAWFAPNAKNAGEAFAHAVGLKKPNSWGLYDIHGNIWEWCSDWRGDALPRGGTNPTGATEGSDRAIRGGCWDVTARSCQSDLRSRSVPSARANSLGFRVALSPVTGATADHVGSSSLKPVGDAPPRAVAPFDEAQAQAHQQAWSDYLGVPIEFTNSFGMRFVLIPPGEFMMGSAPAEIQEAITAAGDDQHRLGSIRSESPQHRVILTQPIYLGAHEVTQVNYQLVMGSNLSRFARTGTDEALVKKVERLVETTRHPVEGVSWNEAVEFCIKLSDHARLQPRYTLDGKDVTIQPGTGYQLPTEAQWEFACRAGTATRYWTGDEDASLSDAAWGPQTSFGRTHIVGELKANPFGLYDTHGNVSEWVQDRWVADYYQLFQNKPATDPTGPESGDTNRVVKGGNWSDVVTHCRAADRHASASTDRFGSLGFRVALPVNTAYLGTSQLIGTTSLASDPDRRAAEYALSLGALIHIKVEGQPQFIRTAAELPPEPFQLTGVELQKVPLATRLFRDCKFLTALSMNGTQVNAGAFEDFQHCDALTHLALLDMPVSDADLENFQQNLKLTLLDVRLTQVTDAGLSLFKDCNEITDLYVSDTAVSDSGISHFMDCPNLRHVLLRNTRITAEHIQEFQKLRPDCKFE